MDITFKDSKKQRRWTYTGVKSLYIYPSCLRVEGWDDLTKEYYSINQPIEDFDTVEMEKSEGEV